MMRGTCAAHGTPDPEPHGRRYRVLKDPQSDRSGARGHARTTAGRDGATRTGASGHPAAWFERGLRDAEIASYWVKRAAPWA